MKKIACLALALFLAPLPALAKDACLLVCPIDMKLDAKKCVCVDARGMEFSAKPGSICIDSMCPDGSARDPKTCECKGTTK